MSIPVAEKHPLPGLPSVLNPEAPLYKVHYKRGANPHCDTLFRYTGDLPGAINLARQWCQVREFKFIHCELALIDLSEDMKKVTD